MHVFKMTKEERNWVLYDVGNSAFTMLTATIMPIYFNHLAGQAGLESAEYLAYWGYAASIVTAIIVILGPTMGSLADTRNFKKKLFLGAVLLGVIGCTVLGGIQHWLAFLAVFVLAKVGYSSSLIFYDSMLSDVTTDDRMDKVSSSGYAWGYIGSCIPFVLSLLLVLGYESIGLTFGGAMFAAFALNGLWWLVMTLPLLKSYRQKHYVETGDRVFSESLTRIVETLRDMKNHKHVLLFVVAFFFYIDGVYTIIDMATAYGQALGLDSTGLLLALLVTQIVAFPFALLYGRLAHRFKTENIITVCIVAYIAIAVYAIFLRTQFQFWVLAVFVGMFQGGIQALSRSHFAKIIPHEKSGEYFGLLDICGKGAAFLGTTLVSLLTQLTGDASRGVSAIAVLIVVGLVVFRMSVKSYHEAELGTNA